MGSGGFDPHAHRSVKIAVKRGGPRRSRGPTDVSSSSSPVESSANCNLLKSVCVKIASYNQHRSAPFFEPWSSKPATKSTRSKSRRPSSNQPNSLSRRSVVLAGTTARFGRVGTHPSAVVHRDTSGVSLAARDVLSKLVSATELPSQLRMCPWRQSAGSRSTSTSGDTPLFSTSNSPVSD